MLRRLLAQADDPDALDRAKLRFALRFPWCWPTSARDETRALALGFKPPTAPPPGVVLLAGESAGANGALWCLRPALPGDEGVPLAGPNRRYVAEVETLLTQAWVLLDDLLPGRRADATGWTATFILRTDGARDDDLTGRSLGLALGLAGASLLVHAPVPLDLCACGELSVETGAVLAVHPAGLRAKLRAIAEAPGIARVLVARSQVEDARRCLPPDSRLDIVPVGSLDEALREAVPALFDRALAPPSSAPLPSRMVALLRGAGRRYEARHAAAPNLTDAMGEVVADWLAGDLRPEQAQLRAAEAWVRFDAATLDPAAGVSEHLAAAQAVVVGRVGGVADAAVERLLVRSVDAAGSTGNPLGARAQLNHLLSRLGSSHPSLEPLDAKLRSLRARPPGGARYTPRPRGASVPLPPFLEALVPALARVAHDAYVRFRLGSQWGYAPTRIDALRLHDDLVPFEMLLPGREVADVVSARGTLQAIVALGWRVEPADEAVQAERYDPLPFRASDLPPEVAALGPLIARQLHDARSTDLLERGWRWGRAVDEERRLDPTLRAFEALPTDAQGPYLQMTDAVLRTLLATNRLRRADATSGGKEWSAYYAPLVPGTAIALPPGFEACLETLAENEHDLWAVEKIRQGHYGPGMAAVDEGRKNDFLVPYADLSADVQELDRVIVVAMVRAVLAFGFELIAPSHVE